ncbi:MAG TPA: PAS domain-containing protein, partial [Bacillota bacterium]|nr:PAS domain-containing protein [Bacillota bacterium]
MFNIEQFPINQEFIRMNPNDHIKEIEQKLTSGSAVYLLCKNLAYLFTPEDLWMIRNQDQSIKEFISDKPSLISSTLSYTREIKDLFNQFKDIMIKNERPIVIEEGGHPIGYCLLSDLLQFSFMEQFYLRSYFFSLSETVTDAVTIVDKNGTVICWNTPAEEMYSIPKDEIIGCRIGEHFEPEALMVLKILDEGRTLRKAYHTPQPNKHVLINASPILKDGKEVIGSIAAEQDITHLVKLNEELSSAYTFKPEDNPLKGDP